MQEDLIDKITELASAIAEDKGLFLVDVEVKPSGKETLVWIYIDAENDWVNLDQYAEISNELSLLLEAHELFDSRYRLNVSSPGLSRPLIDQRQYPKNKGKMAKVKFKRDDFEKATGIISEISESGITIQPEKGQAIDITFDEIVEAKILPVFK